MSAVQPKDLNLGIAQRGAVAHFQETSNNSFKHLEEDISRLQSAFKAFSDQLTYKIGDVVTEGGVRYSNKTAVTVAGAFVPSEWEAFASPTTPLEAEAIAILGMSADQTIPAIGPVIVLFDEVFVDGDQSKIEDQGNGEIKLSNGEFILSTHIGAEADGGSARNMDIIWASSSNTGGPHIPILPPQGRAGQIHTGNATFSTQPKSVAFVDATSNDVFVVLEVQASNTFDIQSASTTASIESHGTSAVANTPLTTKGDLLTHNNSSEQRLAVGPNGQVVVADSGVALGLKYVNSPVEIGRAVVSGSATDSVNLVLDRVTKYIRINFSALNATGTLELHFTFNEDDSMSNGRYAEHDAEIFTGASTGTVMDSLDFGVSPSVADDYSGEIFLTNIQTKPKVGYTIVTAPNADNTEVEPFIREASILWLNMTELLTSIQFFDTTGMGIDVGSEFIAMGWD